MKRKTFFLLLVTALTVLEIFGIIHSAKATPTYLNQYNAKYGTNASCTLCHTTPPSLNSTGTTFLNSGFNLAVIAPVPTVTAFSIPLTSTNLTVSITTFTATDNVAVTGYIVTESATPPSASAAGWSATPMTSYTFASPGAKTLYAWAKDAAGVVSTSLSASTTITLSDTTPPTVTGFSIPATSSSLTVPITTFTATDNVAVTGYMVTESATPPSASAAGWSATPMTSYTFASPGAKILYAWAKDTAGNVSTKRSAKVTIKLPSADTKRPKITAFKIPKTSSSLTVPITTFTATDNVAVTGYMVTESATPPSASAAGWSATPMTSYTFSSPGKKTLYAWAKDAAGNVSTKRSAKVNVTALGVVQNTQGAAIPNAPQTKGNTSATLPYQNGTISSATGNPQNATTVGNSQQNTGIPRTTQNATISGAPQSMNIWVGQWFKIITKIAGSCSGNSGLMSNPGSSVGYLRIWDWDSNNKVLEGDFYEQDTVTGQWFSESLPFHFIAGSDLDFLCWSQSQVNDNTGQTTEGFTARIQGIETGGVLKNATFKTMGGYYIDVTNQSGVIVNCAGGLKLTGTLIQESNVPVPIEVILH